MSMKSRPKTVGHFRLEEIFICLRFEEELYNKRKRSGRNGFNILAQIKEAFHKYSES